MHSKAMLYVLQDTTSYNTHYCGFGYSRYTFPGLSYARTRASNHIVSFAVYVNQISVVNQTFQPDERGVLLNTHDSCLLSYLFAGKRGPQFHEEKSRSTFARRLISVGGRKESICMAWQ